jgi:hypothetical protein
MPDLADAKPQPTLKPGDAVWVTGQSTRWTVIQLHRERVWNDDQSTFEWATETHSAQCYCDAHGVHTFPIAILAWVGKHFDYLDE